MRPFLTLARRPVLLVLLFALLAGFLAVLPDIEHTMSPLYQGLVIPVDKDYANYESRLERALKGYPQEAGNGITTVGSGIEGTQIGGMEIVVADLFGWAHLDAPVLAVVVTFLFTVILFFLFYGLFSVIGFPRWWSFGITLALFITMLHGLSRVMHPGWSDLFMVGSLITFFLFCKRPNTPLLFCSVLLLAILPYLYFWHWTFVWAVCASLVVLLLLSSQGSVVHKKPWMPVLLGCGVLLLSSPFLIWTAHLIQNPLYPQIAVRASFLYERTVESPTRSILLLIDLIAFLSLFRRYKKDTSYLFCASLLLGIAIAMHQNFIHGRVLMFASHFEPHLIICATICGSWALWKRVPMMQRFVIAAIGALFLCAGFYDYMFANAVFLPTSDTYSDQHLASAITQLQKEGMQTVLTDDATGRIVTSWTADGIVYAAHARFLLISDADLAERYCVSEMFNPAPLPMRVLSLEYNRVLQSPEYQVYEQNLLSDACTRVQRNRSTYLKKYGITRILWNSQSQPTWKISVKSVGLTLDKTGSGWTMWSVRN